MQMDAAFAPCRVAVASTGRAERARPGQRAFDLFASLFLLVFLAPRYGSRFRHYCSCRPSLTGLWQASGRSDLSYGRRVELDTLYARTRSTRTDLAILFRTLPVILQRRGSC